MKILFLHGYTQSGPGFRMKTQRLQTHLQKAFPDTKFCFPTGSVKLQPSESLARIQRREQCQSSDDEEDSPIKDPDDIDAYGWFALHDRQDPPRGWLESLSALASILKTEGPFDGVIAFSQGGCLAGHIASLLQGSVRREAFERYKAAYPHALPYPDCFEGLDHPPLKFGVTYSTVMARSKAYACFYSDPVIDTPFLHFVGKWDTTITSGMAEAVKNAQIGGSRSHKIEHPGGHIFPTDAKYQTAVVDFIKSVQIGIPFDCETMTPQTSDVQHKFPFCAPSTQSPSPQPTTSETEFTRYIQKLDLGSPVSTPALSCATSLSGEILDVPSRGSNRARYFTRKYRSSRADMHSASARRRSRHAPAEIQINIVIQSHGNDIPPLAATGVHILRNRYALAANPSECKENRTCDSEEITIVEHDDWNTLFPDNSLADSK